MPSLAELLNSPREFVYGEPGKEKTYHLRAPTLDEEGLYQRWLEEEARASAARATDLPEEDRRRLLADTNCDIAAQVYAWGGEVCVKSLRTPNGIAKLLSIVCADQEVSFRLARKMVERRLSEIAAILVAVNAEGDDEAKKALAGLLTSLGLPANFFSTPSSDSSTSTDLKPSPPSEECPSDKSPDSSQAPAATSTAPPSLTPEAPAG